MAHLVIHVTDANIVSPDMMSVNLQITWVDADSFSRSTITDVVLSATASAAAINEAVRSAGIAAAAAAAHGVTVGPGDVVRVFGGAVPNIS